MLGYCHQDSSLLFSLSWRAVTIVCGYRCAFAHVVGVKKLFYWCADTKLSCSLSLTLFRHKGVYCVVTMCEHIVSYMCPFDTFLFL